MRKIMAVIGANYGDEGKGAVVDYLASKSRSPVVVRFNGGAQAGHTVVTPDGRRHVFSQLGSGSFLGAETFLSKYFVFNPTSFVAEVEKFSKTSQILKPIVHIDPHALVTTPYDVLLNRALEDDRTNRHGSVGLGIHETINRCHHRSMSLHAVDLYDEDALADKVDWIRREWGPMRAKELGLVFEGPLLCAFQSPGIRERYLVDVKKSLEYLSPVSWDAFKFPRDCDVIFEGAQGLMLDMHHSWNFPHVTPSKTGITNVIDMLSDRLGGPLDIYYVTRTYLTRHGAGHLPNEYPALPYPGVRDETNVENAYQGKLRFAYIDIADMAQSIKHDLVFNKSIKVTPHLALTCVDQTGPSEVIHAFHAGSRDYADPLSVLDFVEAVGHEVKGIKSAIIGRGPKRNDISELLL